MISPYYHGKTGLLLHNGDKKDYVWSAEDPLGHLLVLLCPVIKVNGKLQQSNSVTNGKDTSGMKGWFTSPGKDLLKCLQRMEEIQTG